MKFLRNKSIVVILALGALGLVSKNIILPLFHTIQPLSHVESNEEIDKQEGELFQQIEYTTGKSIPMTDFEKLGWAFDYVRDPFKIQTMMDAGTVSVEEIDASVVSGEEKSPPQDVLVAVVHESGKALAVINDVIVGEGDYYKDYKVIKIGLDSVKLEGPDGNKTLEF